MTFAKEDLIEALRRRYDYYSAASVFEIARQRAGLDDKTAFDTSELRAFRSALEAVGDRVTTVLAQLDGWLDGPAPAPPAPAAPTAVAPEKTPARVEKAVEKAAERADKSDRVERPEKSDKVDKTDKKGKAKSGGAPVETTIVVTGVPAKEGEQVLVCGEGEDLGDWEPELARPMSKKGDEWSTTLKLAADAELSFKFLRRTAAGEVIWEDGEDRHVMAKPRVEAKWGVTGPSLS